jgi:signal peptidase I
MIQVVTGPWTWANLRGWVLLIGAVLFIKGCVIDQYAIPSGSMEPTLHGDPRFGRGDRVLVNKWVFGPRIPFTTVRLWEWGTPQRWDIVVFRPVPGTSEHPALIKRVVGLPGEEVRIVEGQIHINGAPVAPPAELADVLHYTTSLGGDPRALKQDFLRLAQINRVIEGLNPNHGPVRQLYADMARVHPQVVGKVIEGLSPEEVDALCEGVAAASLNTIRHWIMYTQPPLKYAINPAPEFTRVPEGHYLVLGDNSPNSVDGRVYGWVPGSNMLGRAFAVWWPWGRRTDFSGFSDTWWGKLLLYGIPALIVAYEASHLLRDRRRKGKDA